MSEDRTSEFMAMARSMPRPQQQSQSSSTVAPTAVGRYSAQQQQRSSPAYQDLRNFHNTASGISKDIAATSAMLSELTQLVRQKSLFDQDSQRVNMLVLKIKGNIENLNSRLDQAGVVLKQQKRRFHTQAGQETSNVIGQLQEEFVQATAGFKRVLQQRTDTMKETSDRKLQVYGSTTQQHAVNLDSTPPVYDTSLSTTGGQFPTLNLTSGLMAPGESTSSTPQLPRPHGVAGHGGGSQYITPSALRPQYSSSFGAEAAPLTPLDIQRMDQQEGQQQQLIPDQTYLRERADAMTQVEANIADLGLIFNKLAVMVSEHQELVQRVDDNVQDVESNVNLSMAVLTDTLTSLRTNKALAMKVFGILVFFIILFIIFIA